jgi:hypothetical protein
VFEVLTEVTIKSLYGAHSVVCHTKDIYWDSLHNNNSETDKIDITVSIFFY